MGHEIPLAPNSHRRTVNWKEAAYAATLDQWGDPPRGLRHFMITTLLTQLEALRMMISDGALSEADAVEASESDFFHGYLFGLVANYCDAAGVMHSRVGQL